ncbi:MAG: tagaturonate epimerase family protein [Kiritimatiellia bacterium]
MTFTDIAIAVIRRHLHRSSQEQLNALKKERLIDGCVYADSLFTANGTLVLMARTATEKRLLLVAASGETGAAFEGETGSFDGIAFKIAPLTAANAAALRRLFPWTAPVSLADRRTTFGCGDRLGRATAGHLRALRRCRVAPVLAQQSMRELTLTGRTYRNVIDDTCFLVYQAGYTEGYGADGDHLKTIADIETALAAGMTMITLDLSEVMRPQAADFSDAQIAAEYATLDAGVKKAVDGSYADATFDLGQGEKLVFPGPEARRCAVMYTTALDFAKQVYDFLVAKKGAGHFDLEISIDETTTPTLPAHHLFFIRELQRRQVTIVSMAPRFIGEFQKGIDYIGNIPIFRRQFTTHCRIAQAHGDYKISVHSGSDKFSIFPIVGEATGGRFHEKTAGTSWLEAVRLAACEAPGLYRRMHAVALKRLPDALKLYHITPDLGAIPDPERLPDSELPKLMDINAARQVLHVTYGYILEDPALKAELFALLHTAEETHEALLDRHFTRHLEGLGIPKK